MENKTIAIIAAVLLLVVGAFWLVGGNQPSLGGTTNFDTLELADGLIVGSTGTTVTNVKTGTCTPTTRGSVAATSTVVFSCHGLTGIVSGDKVFAVSADNQTAWDGHPGFNIISANATSTTGFDFVAQNLTGAATTGVASLASLQYWIVR